MKKYQISFAAIFFLMFLPFCYCQEVNKNEYLEKAEVMPEFPGGNEAFLKFLSKNIIYPIEAKNAGVEGKVYVKAYIDETGKIVKAEVSKGIDKNLDEAAVSAVKKIKFNPGKNNGKAVKVQVVIPIMFKLS